MKKIFTLFFMLTITSRAFAVFSSSDFVNQCSTYDKFAAEFTNNITYNLNGGTNFSGAPTTYTYGTGATIAGTPTKSGYGFVGWCTDQQLQNCAMTQTITTTMSGDITFYAKWGTQYTVTYSCGDGTGTPPSQQTAISGAQFTPAVNTCSKSGYMFTGWGVSGTNDVVGAPFTWNYNENKTLTVQWTAAKFTLTTTELTASGTFEFRLSASGTFYVDCGSGGTLSGTGVSGNTITRSDTTNNTTYTCTYSSAGAKTIGFYGTATGYNTGTSIAAISFYQSSNNSAAKIASISGNLSSMFPWLSGNTASGAAPRFYQTFYGATNLNQIPDTLFAGYTNVNAARMFNGTFYGCTGLSEIPGNLFAGVTGAASYMFSYTFSGCTGLESIPGNLFAGVTGAAEGMFSRTFYACTGLESIPGNLFAGVTGAAIYMFSYTFSGCTGLGEIPGNLFAGVTGAASYMFSSTFNGCTNIEGYIQPSTFAGLIENNSPVQNYMWRYTFTNTQLATSCPGNTSEYPTGYKGANQSSDNFTKWGNYVSCIDTNEQQCSVGEYLPKYYDSCQICPNDSYCAGGSYSFNTENDQGIVSCGVGLHAPAGMWESAQCGRVLHIGDNVVYLRAAKKTTPSLNVKVGDNIYYGNMTTLDVPMTNGTERKLRLHYDNTTYSVYDDSVVLPTE